MVDAIGFLLFAVLLHYHFSPVAPEILILAQSSDYLSFVALACFRRYKFYVRKYNWMAFELSSSEHKTTSCQNFPYSPSNFWPYILGSPETVVTQNPVAHNLNQYRLVPSASETYHFSCFMKEKDREALGFLVPKMSCSGSLRSTDAHALLADSVCDDRIITWYEAPSHTPSLPAMAPVTWTEVLRCGAPVWM